MTTTTQTALDQNEIELLELIAELAMSENKSRQALGAEVKRLTTDLRARLEAAEEALQEIAQHAPHLDDEQFEETHSRVAMLMRRLARAALAQEGEYICPICGSTESNIHVAGGGIPLH
jgi:hypothetical protein